MLTKMYQYDFYFGLRGENRKITRNLELFLVLIQNSSVAGRKKNKILSIVSKK